MSLSLIDRRWCFNSIEECCIEDCSWDEVFGVIRQSRYSGLAESLQFVGFRQRLGSIFDLSADAGTLRLGKILSRFYITDSNAGVRMNRQRCAIGKNNAVKGHVCCSRAREIATQKLSFMPGRTGN